MERSKINEAIELITKTMALLNVCQMGKNVTPTSDKIVKIDSDLRKIRDELIAL